MRKRAVIYNKLVESENDLKEAMHQKEIAEKQVREKELFAQEVLLQMEFNEAIIQQRRQISDDMHDELCSSLAALKFYVANIKNRAENNASEPMLTEIEEEISTIYSSARNYTHGLKTNNWETRFSLLGFLKEIQQKFSEKALMVVKLDIEEDKIKQKLSSQQHDQLYHIIRESISNAIKHAAASELSISIRFKKDKCIFSIADNGKGFGHGQIVHGIGIKSIQKRMQDIGGELHIDSSDQGITINGFFPVY